MYSSSWGKSHQLRAWAGRHLHADVAHGQGMAGAELLAEKLQDVYSRKKGCLATLDWAQAFDRMAPAISVGAMQRTGLAPPLARLLGQVWGRHERFLQFDNHVHPRTLSSGGGMPQGDPLSPFLLSFWVSAGLRRIEQNVPHDPKVEFRTVCYMDDRSFWSNSSQAILDRIERWHVWSQNVGLKESPQKTQLAAKSTADRQVFSARYPENLHDEVTILGVTSVSKKRKINQKESDRIEAAARRALILATAPITWTLKLRAFQSLVVSKLAYGWIGMNPLRSVADATFNTLTHCLQTGKGASRDLRNLFYGTLSWLPTVILTRRWSRMSRALKLNRPSYHWNPRTPFSSVHNLRLGIKNLGFVESEPWVWKAPVKWNDFFKHSEQSLDLSVNSHQPLGLQLHILRQGHRLQAFLNFKKRKRRDARLLAELGDTGFDHFVQVDLKGTRKELEANGATRAAVFGSFVSSAALFSASKHEDFHQSLCPFCHTEVGTMEHLIWNCVANPVDFAILTNWFQKRFGWHVLRSPLNNKVSRHMASTIDRLWRIRHNT